jgi:hypothetical protein
VTENDKSFSTFALLSSTTYLSIIPSRSNFLMRSCGNGQIQFQRQFFRCLYSVCNNESSFCLLNLKSFLFFFGKRINYSLKVDKIYTIRFNRLKTEFITDY